MAVANDPGAVIPPVRYGFRSFDRQWIIPDNRLINQPNPNLWAAHGERQLYLTALNRTSPASGPALTFTGLIPDLDHYHGRGGRVFPVWRDSEGHVPNIPPDLLAYLGERYGREVSAEDLMAYIGGIAAHPAFTARFQDDLVKPGLRIPLTADRELFEAAVEIGREVIWLHTFGERFADPAQGRPEAPPRLAPGDAPRIPEAGAIPHTREEMPDDIDYDAEERRLLVGGGYIDGVDPRMWSYEVSGKQVLRQWFSYRKADRGRPIIGDRRAPSKLGDIQPDRWLPEYTTELLNVLHVLGRLVDLEPSQAELLDQICAGPTISAEELHTAGALDVPAALRKAPLRQAARQPSLLDGL